MCCDKEWLVRPRGRDPGSCERWLKRMTLLWALPKELLGHEDEACNACGSSETSEGVALSTRIVVVLTGTSSCTGRTQDCSVSMSSTNVDTTVDEDLTCGSNVVKVAGTVGSIFRDTLEKRGRLSAPYLLEGERCTYFSSVASICGCCLTLTGGRSQCTRSRGGNGDRHSTVRAKLEKSKNGQLDGSHSGSSSSIDLLAHCQSNLDVVRVAVVSVANCCGSDEVLAAAKASGVRLQTVVQVNILPSFFRWVDARLSIHQRLRV